ncbi:MAG: Mitomycin resistance protein mcrB [Acidobacteria bacterium]|nr:Mitomycin resistance protein mcrB [Acidobacteriota bacterium]
MRQLAELSGIGKAMLGDFEMLGVDSVAKLARCDADELYHRLCELTGQRQDPCVHDTFRCAIEQARNPDLEPEKRNWWYWSKVRKAQGPVL